MGDIVFSKFNGLLGRVIPKETGLLLRVYPFAFNNDASASCVFQVEAEGANLSEEQMSLLVGAEVDVTVSSNSILIDGLYLQRETVIPADDVTARLVTYDVPDFVDRVSVLEDTWKHTNTERFKARQKLSKISALVEELTRRAIIKSNASEAQKAKQATALRILERMRAELESDKN